MTKVENDEYGLAKKLELKQALIYPILAIYISPKKILTMLPMKAGTIDESIFVLNRWCSTVYIDSIIGLLIPMHFGHFEFNFIPHLILLYILLITIYRGFGIGLIFAILFGIVTDIYVGSVYGLYMFGYLALVVIFDKFLKVFIETIQ